MSVYTVDFIATIICVLCAYVISVPLANSATALVARLFGDETAADEGFLSLNPLHHIDALGLYLVIFFGLGWGAQVPVNPSHIKTRHKTLATLLTFATESIVALIVALVSLVLLMVFYGLPSVIFAAQIMATRLMPLHEFAQAFPERSSGAIVGAIILLAFVFFNLFIASLSAILNSFRCFFAISIEKNYKIVERADQIMLFGPLIALFFFADIVRALLLYVTVQGAYAIAHLFGGIS